ncbi:MAG: S-layer homology domain-containing protein [Chitinophagales bacterium]
MHRYIVKLAAVMVCLVMLYPVVPVMAYDVPVMPGATQEMMQVDFWLSKIKNPNQVVMTPAEIESLNSQTRQKLPYLVYDLSLYPTSFPRERLKKFIDQPFPTGKCYMESKLVSTSYWQSLHAKLNLEGLAADNPVQYGLTVRRTNMKIYPTFDVIGDEANDPGYDMFQDTSVLAAEPLVILHQSLDSKWYYTQMYNVIGWVPAEDVAITDRASWLAYQRSNEFLLITANRMQLDNNPLSPETSELEFTMGTKLPLVPAAEVPQSLDQRITVGNYIVKLPVRDSEGKLNIKMVPIPMSNDVSLGYLAYTRANVLKQAFKMLGDRYGWGGMLNGRDCSALVMELYRCFGVYLPRNSASQANSAGKTLKITGSNSYRNLLLNKLQPGDFVVFPGHEMLYIGSDNGRHYVMSSLGSYAEIKPGEAAKSMRVRTVAINDLYLKRMTGKQWLEVLTTGKQLDKTSFIDLVGNPDQAVIENLADQFIMGGTDDTHFAPDARMTRAEITVVLSNLLAVEPVAGPDQSWYSGPAAGLKNAGIIANDGDAYLKTPVSRAEMAALVQRAAGYNKKNKPAGNVAVLNQYRDQNEIPAWAREGAAFSLAAGIIKGESSTDYKPDETLSRAEVAVIIARLQQYIQNQKQ